MASKPLSTKYARRIERALAQGKTRQEARGHRAREHVARREREKEQFGGLTGDQIRSIRRWYREQYNPDGTKDIINPKTGRRGAHVEEFIELAQANSFSQFSDFRKAWSQRRRTYIRESMTGKYSSRGEDYGTSLSDFFGEIPEGDDIGWLYYH